MLEQIAKNIRARKLVRDGEHLLVAVSGGLDSMVLLHVLHSLASEHILKLTVVHFNHRLRGRESDGDEKFVRQAAKQLRLPIVVDAADVKAHATDSKQSIEMAARELRHAFFARTAKILKIRTIALAHQADDQVELFFLRLLRGASVDGLAGMRWRNASPADRSVQLVRPLLNLSRMELEAFARERSIHWREDTSNLSTDFLRNRVRRELLPLLQKRYQPGLRKSILRLTELLRAESDVVADVTREALKKVSSFEKLPVAVQRRSLQQQVLALGVNADFETTESLRLNTGKVVELNPTTRLQRDEKGRVQVVTKSAPQFTAGECGVELEAGVTKVKFGDRALTFRVARQRGRKFAPRANNEYFDADRIGPKIVLRHWQAGDRFQPIGSKSSRKLQDMFVDLKVPKSERHMRVIAMTAEGKIFWVEGLRIGEKFKLTDETTRRLVLRWRTR
ncbi:MAG: tRNA(Ile)-lysidine synthase [Verrucomicrobiales bacterium]|nr:tRNA(Ile)-lysidine synthase [Verrucomicrobiales bacterium]